MLCCILISFVSQFVIRFLLFPMSNIDDCKYKICRYQVGTYIHQILVIWFIFANKYTYLQIGMKFFIFRVFFILPSIYDDFSSSKWFRYPKPNIFGTQINNGANQGIKVVLHVVNKFGGRIMQHIYVYNFGAGQKKWCSTCNRGNSQFGAIANKSTMNDAF